MPVPDTWRNARCCAGEAERYRNLVEADKIRGLWIDPSLSKVAFGEWIAEVEAGRSVRANTRARDEASLRNHVLPRFGQMRLVDVQPQDIRRWLAGLESKGLAPGTIVKAYQIVRRGFAVAVDDGRLARSPCRGISAPRVEPPDHRYLSADEVNLLANAIDPRFRALVLTAAHTGLRIGELAALRVSRFSALGGLVRVDSTLTEVSGHVRFGPPKSRASRRTVAISRSMAETIAQHIEAFPDPDDLIFTSPRGGPLRVTNFRRRYWKPAVDSSVGQPCTFHDLRHTNVALLIAAGVQAKVIQERLGHGSIRVTLDTYGHLFEGLDSAAAEALDAILTWDEFGPPSEGRLLTLERRTDLGDAAGVS